MGGFGGGEGKGVPGDGGGGFLGLAGDVFRYGDDGGAIGEGDLRERRRESLGDFEGGNAPGAGEELHGLPRRLRRPEHAGVKRVGSPGLGLGFVHSERERERKLK